MDRNELNFKVNWLWEHRNPMGASDPWIDRRDRDNVRNTQRQSTITPSQFSQRTSAQLIGSDLNQRQLDELKVAHSRKNLTLEFGKNQAERVKHWNDNKNFGPCEVCLEFKRSGLRLGTKKSKRSKRSVSKKSRSRSKSKTKE